MKSKLTQKDSEDLENQLQYKGTSINNKVLQGISILSQALITKHFTKISYSLTLIKSMKVLTCRNILIQITKLTIALISLI